MSDLFAETGWQMTFGERAALEGLLVLLKPQLAIEIGTLNGGSLRRIAAHSEEVHAFDFDAHPDLRAQIPNAVFHVGDSHELLPLVLADLTAQGRTVDFALVDGDASAVGVQADLQALLGSPAVCQTVILVHDSLNEGKRAAIESISGVSYIDLDFVPGHVFADEDQQQWLGFALVLVGDFRLADDLPMGVPRWDHAELARRARLSDTTQRWGGDVILKLERSNQELRESLEKMERSASWRLTAPLRALKAWLRARL
jgi:hypothetical protein